MNRIIPFLIFAILLMVNACGPKDPSENEKLREEVIAVHDEVMPKMGKLKSLELQARQRAEQLQNEAPVDSAKVEEYKALAYDLNHAHESMFSWMHQYEPDHGEQSEEEVKKYLDNQMILVSEVNTEIKEALAKAEKLLE